jgi:replicative DNA helicase
MNNLIKQAQQYCTLGLSVILLDNNKAPALSGWTDLQATRLSAQELSELSEGKTIRPELLDKEGKPAGIKVIRNVKGIGILGGKTSGTELQPLEIIDVDTKYDTTGTLWENLTEHVTNILGQKFFQALTIATTRSGGYHIYYRATNAEPNQPLAKRPATAEEIQQGKKGDKAILETRGPGGYVACPPTPGYEFIQGSAEMIPVITPAERNELKNICKGFDTAGTYDRPERREKKKDLGPALPGVSTIEDYQNQVDVLDLLEDHDFTIASTAGEITYIKRKGSSASSSGNFHEKTKLLKFFSTNVDGFEAERAYPPFKVYSILEHEGNDKKAFSKLFSDGYGSKEWREAWLESKQEEQPPHPADVFDSKTINIETTDTKTGEVSSVLAPGGSVKAKDLSRLAGDRIILQLGQDTPETEALQAIRTAVKSGKRVLVSVHGEEPIYWYNYELEGLLPTYQDYIAESGGLTDSQIEDLRTDIVSLGLRIPDPMDRDLYRETITSGPFAQLGITPESLDITLDELRADQGRENQKKELDLLLGKVANLQEEGKTQKALEALSKKVSDIKLLDKAGEFDKLLRPTSEEEIKKEEASLPESLNTGFIIAGEELLLPGGQLSVYAGPTNHGKTIVLINTALQVADRYPDKRFIFFSYEERANSIIQYFLNTYINIDLNSSKGGNRRLLRDYFRTGSTQFIAQANRGHFESKKAEFFRDYIENGRILIKGVDYNSEELDLAIRHLHKKEPSLGGVFIDYFQLLRLPQAQSKNSRQEELKQICQDLNSLAKNTGLPLILSAQFNREVTNLMRLHPTNIGEAGDIERIVNTLIGLWNMDKKPVLKGITDAEATEINNKIRKRRLLEEGAKNMYLEILKSRDLPTGSFDFLEFNGNTGKVSNRDTTLDW